MALINTPPWLMPTDVIGAMSAGGRLGLGSAELGERARESDQRTGLGYAQLGADQASAGAALHAKLAEHALALALHQSTQEEQKRKDQAMEQLRGMAIEQSIKKDAETQAETKRAHTAAESLKQKGLDLAAKKEQDVQETAFKKQQIQLAHQRLMQAEKAYQDAVKSGNKEQADSAKSHLDDVRRHYETLSGDYTDASGVIGPAPTAGEQLFPQIPIPGPATFTLPQIPPGTGFIPMGETKSGNRYSIEPVGE